MRNYLKFAPLAGAALLVAACGGGAANNTANAPVVDNGTVVDNMAPDMNAPMPDANMTTNTTASTGNATTTTTTTTTNTTTNAM